MQFGHTAQIRLYLFCLFAAGDPNGIYPVFTPSLSSVYQPVLGKELHLRVCKLIRGNVFDSTPKFGQKVAEGTEITLYVSLGSKPETVSVPRVMGEIYLFQKQGLKKALKCFKLALESEKAKNSGYRDDCIFLMNIYGQMKKKAEVKRYYDLALESIKEAYGSVEGYLKSLLHRPRAVRQLS